MIEVVLTWSVREVDGNAVGPDLTALADFELSVHAREAGVEALRDSLLRQLCAHFVDTVFLDVLRVAEMQPLKTS